MRINHEFDRKANGTEYYTVVNDDDDDDDAMDDKDMSKDVENNGVIVA
jgi:hypothetical protein